MVMSRTYQCCKGCSEEKQAELVHTLHSNLKTTNKKTLQRNKNTRREEMQNRCVGPLMYLHPAVKTESVNVSTD